MCFVMAVSTFLSALLGIALWLALLLMLHGNRSRDDGWRWGLWLWLWHGERVFDQWDACMDNEQSDTAARAADVRLCVCSAFIYRPTSPPKPPAPSHRHVTITSMGATWLNISICNHGTDAPYIEHTPSSFHAHHQ